MILMFEVALVAALVAALVLALGTKRRARVAEALIAQRVEAYTATIRREGGPLAALGPVELADVLTMAARNLRQQGERRWFGLVIGGFLGFLSAIFIGTQQGTQGFVLTLLVVAAVLYGLYQYIGRQMREALERQGIEPDRLRVE